MTCNDLTDRLVSRKRQVPFRMATGNGEIMHECFPEHLRMGTAWMEYDKETYEESKKRGVNICTAGTKKSSPDKNVLSFNSFKRNGSKTQNVPISGQCNHCPPIYYCYTGMDQQKSTKISIFLDLNSSPLYFLEECPKGSGKSYK